jgi:hypothetical protein
MKFTLRPPPDPVCEIKTHDGSLRWALQAAEDVVGKPGLAIVLKEVEVKEIECRAMGAPACVWEMSKLPLN